MKIYNQYFSPEIIKRIQQTIKEEPDISRRKLSRIVCAWLDWKALNGKLQEMSCRKALNRLDAKGYISLPEVTFDYAYNHDKNDAKEVLPGISYKASNWIQVGHTAGRKNPYPNGKRSTGKKIIYLFPLRSNWQQILRRDPEYPLGTCGKPDNPADWVEEKFSGVKLFDDRLKERLYSIARDLYEKPGALVPRACGGLNARAKGMYRFMSNPKVNMELLLRPHIESTVERMKEYPIVLAVQDTTSLNHSSHPYTNGIGPIMENSKKTLGMFMHDTMAFSEEGVPLGLLNVQCWARGPEDEGKGKKRHSLPIEKKESYKWIRSYWAACEARKVCPETLVISVGDREADIYELFVESTRQSDGADLLIRSIRSRCRRTEAGDLWESMAECPVSGYRDLLTPQKGVRPKRIARLSVRFSKVDLAPPRSKKDLPIIPIWVVYVKEEEYPQDEEPIEWMLLTTVETNTIDQACRRVEWYATRWGIEVFHRTLKSGCNVENRRFRDIDRLKNSLAYLLFDN